jgi:hypothetical protein
MITSVFIIAASAVLFIYWLRYSCVILLRTARENIPASAEADDRFSVSSVRERLKTESDLAALEHALERDYRVVTYLIEHAADLELASIENRLLVLDYKLMRLWSHLTRSFAPQKSREALAEMASVLSVLVGQMDGQSPSQMEA